MNTTRRIRTISIVFAALLLYGSTSVSLFAQNRADRQNLSDPESFSMILLGDPQSYMKYDVNQPIFDLCTAWIADNVDHLKIKAVLCVGDLVEQNENIVRNRKMVNQTSREMWEAVSKSFARLDNKVSYVISCGNHDYGYVAAENAMTRFPEYFPFERNPVWRDLVVDALPNRNGIPSLENAAFEFVTPHWKKILVITSEFHPRDEVLDWATKLASSDRFQDHFVIFMTHAYMSNHKNESKRLDSHSYKLQPGNTGEEVWKKLVQPAKNIRLVLCGHIGDGNGKFIDNVGYRVDPNADGKNVHQMMFNVQCLGGGWEGNGGDGWLRILEFLPDGKTMKVKTYSPLFGISPSTKHLAHRTEEFDQFDVVFD